MKYRPLLERANDTFGEDIQYMLTKEETAELIKELSDFIIDVSHLQRGRTSDLIEEAADVRLLCDQLAVTFDRVDEYETFLEEKRERLDHRIDDATE